MVNAQSCQPYFQFEEVDLSLYVLSVSRSIICHRHNTCLLLVSVLDRLLSGHYMLSVKFNDEHITNSPFCVRVAGAPAGHQDNVQSRLMNTLGYQVRLSASISEIRFTKACERLLLRMARCLQTLMLPVAPNKAVFWPHCCSSSSLP